MTAPLVVETTRGAHVETLHHVLCRVVDTEGRLVAGAGEPAGVTWWRSAAKPFQALPLVVDGAAQAFGLRDEELAIACASHSSEPEHLEVVDGFLRRIGLGEGDLACGPHPPLSSAVHRALLREGREPTALWSNCSGKHAGMLALARHHGWATEGYERADHPVQQRIRAEIARWSDLSAEAIATSVDGCAATCFGLPLDAMALAWARFGAGDDPAARRLRGAMQAHPWLVAGTGRPCTRIMEAWPGQVLAKVGAEGVYGAAVPALRLGVAIKVVDGDMRIAAMALVAVLQALAAHSSGRLLAPRPGMLDPWVAPEVRNTRGAVTGHTRVRGGLVFFA